MEKMALMFILVAVALPALSFAYTTQIHAPAVLQNQYTGELTLIQLNVTPGNGSVAVKGPEYVNETTIQSAQTAAAYAAQFAGVSESQYNFTYYILGNTINVSGPSAGLAFTLLGVYGLESKPLYPNFTVTGTINPDGSVGLVGGVYDKAGAAAAAGMHYLVVPNASSDALESLIYYIAQQTYKLPVVQVSDVAQAASYGAGVSPSTIAPYAPNLTQSFNLSAVSNATLSCTQCNTRAFAELVNFTYEFANQAVENISSNYSAVAEQLNQSIAQDEQISAKGYLYTGADLAFLQYPYGFVLANAGYYSKADAYGTLGNISSYCASLSPPQLTNFNYEYVLGGELRQALAQVDLNEGYAQLNASESTDDIINALSTGAQAYAWCSASDEMYQLAQGIGGAPVQTSASLNATALADAQASLSYPGIYSKATQLLYNESEYAAAIYGATYAKSFGNSTGPANFSNAEIALLERQDTNDTYGIWPTQFADSSLFYLQQAAAPRADVTGDISSAYSLTELATNLDFANQMIAANLTAAVVPVSPALTQRILLNQSEEIFTLQQRSDMLSFDIEFLSALVLLMLCVLMFVFVRELHRIKMAKRASKGNGASTKRKR